MWNWDNLWPGMIQRIQSVYLLLVAVCAVVCLCMPVGHFHQEGIGVADFYNLWLTMADGSRVFAPWAMFALLLVSAVSAFVAIFLFKRRMVQVRLSVFCGLLLIGYYAVFGIFVYVFKSRYAADFTLNWTMAFPAVALILDYLAFRNIMKDELMIRSLNRLR